MRITMVLIMILTYW